jgi:3-carboxy-cis,cis-muconate cycloisomerase
MPAHILDSLFLKDLYGTAEMRLVFDDMHFLQKWLEVEAALAQAEAELGIIPEAAAREIARCAVADELDVSRIKRLIDQTVHPIVPLIRVLQDACSGDVGEYIHWGATTQDIMDTAMILQAQEAAAILDERLEVLSDALGRLASVNKDTIMPGRTHGQQALPITFGVKVAVWLAEVERHRQRLLQCRPRLLVGQLGGAVSTLASLRSFEQGLSFRQVLAEHPLVSAHLTPHQIEELLNPAQYTGLAGQFVDRVLLATGHSSRS